MKTALRIFLLLNILCFHITASYSQLFPKKNYPRNYFQWPVGATVALAANFGELRPNHFHMGLDCKTNKRQNLPVYAAADGYIAKVKIEPYGFGRCIYINHPNGLTTLYAHLNAFYPALEQYITQQQYALRRWNIFVDIPPGIFKVNKGQFIANSGNTGGSQGPHLHFEIRDTKTDKVLNPLLFGFLVTDNIPPNILKLAVYDRCISTYEQSPKIYSLKKVNGVYVPTTNIVVNTEKVSFAITAYDRYTGSTNQNGIYQAILFDNDVAVSGFEMDSISYDETRYLNAHIDYKHRSNGGNYLQHLSQLPGNTKGIYKSNGKDGVIELAAGEDHDIRIEVNDPNGNSSLIKFPIMQKGIVEDNKNDAGASQNLFLPGFLNVFENEKVSFYLPENCLYDSIRFRYNETISNGTTVLQLHSTSVPLHTFFSVKIKSEYPAADTSKMVIKRHSGSKEDFTKAYFINGWFNARFREFGNFQLMEDKIPPVLTPIGFRDGMNASRSSRIMFSVKDNTEEIKNFTALLDGKWLRFTNDKGRTFIYNFDENCSPGNHELAIKVEDQVGNITERNYRFTR